MPEASITRYYLRNLDLWLKTLVNAWNILANGKQNMTGAHEELLPEFRGHAETLRACGRLWSGLPSGCMRR